MTAGLNLTALYRAREAMAKRQAAGKPAPRVPFVEAALGYDALPAGAYSEREASAGAGAGNAGGAGGGRDDHPTDPVARYRERMRDRQRRRSGAAITPGRRPKEDSRYAYQHGNNYIDRQVPVERELESEET